MARVNEHPPEWLYDYFIDELPSGCVDATHTMWKFFDLVMLTRWVDTKSEARRLITSGAIRIKNERITDPNRIVRLREFDYGKFLMLVKKNEAHVIEAVYPE